MVEHYLNLSPLSPLSDHPTPTVSLRVQPPAPLVVESDGGETSQQSYVLTGETSETCIFFLETFFLIENFEGICFFLTFCNEDCVPLKAINDQIQDILVKYDDRNSCYQFVNYGAMNCAK